jgi:hypothetical protein
VLLGFDLSVFNFCCAVSNARTKAFVADVVDVVVLESCSWLIVLSLLDGVDDDVVIVVVDDDDDGRRVVEGAITDEDVV